MDTQTYTVTERAGPRVAGRAVSLGQSITLSTNEAEAELLAGAIVLQGQTPPAAFDEASPALEQIRSFARAEDLNPAPRPQPVGPGSAAQLASTGSVATPTVLAGTPPAAGVPTKTAPARSTAPAGSQRSVAAPGGTTDTTGA